MKDPQHGRIIRSKKTGHCNHPATKERQNSTNEMELTVVCKGQRHIGLLPYSLSWEIVYRVPDN